MKRRVQWWSGALIGLVAITLAGCGSGGRLATFPVSGQVMIDGEPAEDVVVRFFHQDPEVTGDSRFPVGKTDSDGRFRLNTAIDAPGAIAGVYRVSFAWMSGNELTSSDRFDGKYSDPSKTGVEVEVPDGGIDLPPLHLSSEGPPKSSR